MVDDEAQMTTKDQELTESEIAALLNAVSDNTSDIYSLEALEKQNDTYNEFKTLEIINSHFARGLERTLSYVAQRIVHVEVETWGLMRRDDCLKQTSQMATCASAPLHCWQLWATPAIKRWTCPLILKPSPAT